MNDATNEDIKKNTGMRLVNIEGFQIAINQN